MARSDESSDCLGRDSMERALGHFEFRTADADGLRHAAVALAVGGEGGDRRLLLTSLAALVLAACQPGAPTASGPTAVKVDVATVLSQQISETDRSRC